MHKSQVKGLKAFKKTGEVLMKILSELADVYEEQIPITLVIEKAVDSGVAEDTVKSILSEWKKYAAVVRTGPNTIKISPLMRFACRDLKK